MFIRKQKQTKLLADDHHILPYENFSDTFFSSSSKTRDLSMFSNLGYSKDTVLTLLKENTEGRKSLFKNFKEYEHRQLPLLVWAIKYDIDFDQLQNVLSYTEPTVKPRDEATLLKMLEERAEVNTSFYMLMFSLKELVNDYKNTPTGEKMTKVINQWEKPKPFKHHR